jgi:hypothetical protein
MTPSHWQRRNSLNGSIQEVWTPLESRRLLTGWKSWALPGWIRTHLVWIIAVALGRHTVKPVYCSPQWCRRTQAQLSS